MRLSSLLIAELGAEIIKVEQSPGGDPLRHTRSLSSAAVPITYSTTGVSKAFV
ncbi:MAG: CoA transferase [Candidatus Reddybacter sp.]